MCNCSSENHIVCKFLWYSKFRPWLLGHFFCLDFHLLGKNKANSVWGLTWGDQHTSQLLLFFLLPQNLAFYNGSPEMHILVWMFSFKKSYFKICHQNPQNNSMKLDFWRSSIWLKFLGDFITSIGVHPFKKNGYKFEK